MNNLLAALWFGAVVLAALVGLNLYSKGRRDERRKLEERDRRWADEIRRTGRTIDDRVRVLDPDSVDHELFENGWTRSVRR